MDKDKLVATLKQIEELAKEALQGVNREINQSKKRTETVRKQPSAKSLPDQILRLRSEDFFKQARTPKDVHEKLQSIYPCDLNRVEVALLRLQKRKKLRKTSITVGKEKLFAYAW